MDAFGQADAMVQGCSGIFGIVAVAFLVYFSFFPKQEREEIMSDRALFADKPCTTGRPENDQLENNS